MRKHAGKQQQPKSKPVESVLVSAAPCSDKLFSTDISVDAANQIDRTNAKAVQIDTKHVADDAKHRLNTSNDCERLSNQLLSQSVDVVKQARSSVVTTLCNVA